MINKDIAKQIEKLEHAEYALKYHRSWQDILQEALSKLEDTVVIFNGEGQVIGFLCYQFISEQGYSNLLKQNKFDETKLLKYSKKLGESKTVYISSCIIEESIRGGNVIKELWYNFQEKLEQYEIETQFLVSISTSGRNSARKSNFKEVKKFSDTDYLFAIN